jgi:NAD(P)-dependent dehydrogenase (short-subunit alcohol dehydrogenase family)
MTKQFENKAVFVTGAGTGIGYAICKKFAQEGATVALNEIDKSLAQNAVAKINQAVGREAVLPYSFDVANVVAVRSAIQDFAERAGRLDVVVANAGITNYGSFLEYTPEAFDRLYGVNLRGTYFTAQAGAQAMIARNIAGRIIVMSSVTGVQAFMNFGAYGVTKAGIVHIAKTLAVELGEFGITVNAIAPGITRTERTQMDDPNIDENWIPVVANRRVGEPQDVAGAVAFFASDSAQQVTGQTLIVDGGWTIHSPIPENQPENPAASSQLR